MHISLDSALGRQRRLNSVGESVLQIAPNAAAAYSLRSLTGGDPKVVRVRRGSDNHEQDFTASGVSSGALTSFVNAQVVAPLDIQALSATGRDGDFLIAKAAYSLRSLGTRQATVTSSGDTDGDTSGKYVVQVRRSSDDKIKSFTANQVGTSGSSELEDFCDEATPARNRTGGAKYSSFSTDGVAGFSAVCSAAAAAGYDISGASGTAVQVSFDIVLNSGSLSVQLRPEFETGSVVSNSVTIDSSGSKSFTLTSTAEFKALLFISGATDFVVSNFSVNVPYNHSAFVKTWYDQSVTNQAGDTATGNHAVQATASKQPKIVNAGSYLSELNFDGTNSALNSINLISSLNSASAFIVAKTADDTLSGKTPLALSGGSDRFYIPVISSGSYYFGYDASSTAIEIGDADTDYHLFTGIAGSSNAEGFMDGQSGGTLTSVSDYTALSAGGIGAINTTQSWNGGIREVVVYNSDQSDNRTAIEANIGEAYNIDLPSGVDPGFDQVDGFVETWYDQSGNGNDAVQATAGSQPKIVNAGSLLADGLTFDGSDDSMTTTSAISSTNIAIACVSKSANNATAGIFSMLDGFNDGHEALYLAGEIRIASNSSDLDVLITTTNQNLYFANYDGSTQSLSSNGGTPSTKSTSQTISVSAVAQIGSRSGGNKLNGSIEELIVYASDQSANRAALETNILSHYGIS